MSFPCFHVICALGIFGFVGSTLGSKIEFSANPMVMTPPLTQNLGMKCSLQDTSVIIGKRDVNETSENMAHVTSIIITRNEGKHVASVSQFESAKAVVDSGQLMVTGDVSGAHDEKAYIKLSWTNPVENQATFYECEINAVDSIGHIVVFRSQLEIPTRKPTLTDLVQYTHDLASIIQNQESKIHTQESKIQTQESKIQTQESKIKAQASEIHDLKSNFSDHHIESGRVQCRETYHAASWPSLPSPPDHRGDTVSVTFKKPYSKIPVVNVGIILLDSDHSRHTRIQVDAVSITRTGFSATCITWGDSLIYNLGMEWISFLE